MVHTAESKLTVFQAIHDAHPRLQRIIETMILQHKLNPGRLNGSSSYIRDIPPGVFLYHTCAPKWPYSRTSPGHLGICDWLFCFWNLLNVNKVS